MPAFQPAGLQVQVLPGLLWCKQLARGPWLPRFVLGP